MGTSITSSNSIYVITVPPLYPAPQTLQGYMADAAFTTDSAEIAEIVLGVDGAMSAGYMPYLTKQTIHIMPNSASSLLFENWAAAEKVASEKLFATATIALPAISRKYRLSNGVLSGYMAVPNARRILEGRQFVITWGSIDPAIF